MTQLFNVRYYHFQYHRRATFLNGVVISIIKHCILKLILIRAICDVNKNLNVDGSALGLKSASVVAYLQ